MNSEAITREGVLLTGIQHCVMAVFFIFVTALAILKGVLPAQGDLFLPLTASVTGLALAAAYIAVAAGLFGRREWARVGGIVLSMIGVGLGLLILMEAVASTVRSLQPDWSAVVGVGLAAVVVYLLVTLFDLAALLFLLSPRTRAAFTGAPYPATAPDALSPLELVASRFIRNGNPPPEG